LAQSPNLKQDILCRPPLPVAVLDEAERIACLRLIRTDTVGPATFRRLVNQLGGARQALDALPDLFKRGKRAKPVQIYSVEHAEAELEQCRKLGIKALFSIEPGYPAALAAIDYPPPLLYTKGDVAFLNRTAVAIIGARRCSAAGAALTRQIASDLGRHGIVVVSGLARGIDGAAHEAALATGTVAVMAGGLDQVYPPEHEKLFKRIERVGCLVSEQPPGFSPRGQDFPRRNRIISGLSHAVVVIEAAQRSGSLTTARMAGEQGRDVFAVPGHPLDPRAEGTNGLIKQGALMVTCARDILSALAPLFRDEDMSRWQIPDAMPPEFGDDAKGAHWGAHWEAHVEVCDRTIEHNEDNENRIKAAVRAVLGPAPISIDEVCRATGLAAAIVQRVVMELELSGEVESHGHHMISLCTKP